MLNMVFSKWGLTQLKKGDRKQKRDNGKVVDTTPVVITKEYDIDVYKYIKPKKIRETKKQVESTTSFFDK